MENENTIRAGSIRLSTVATTTRQTPKTDFGSVMRSGLIRAGNVVAEGLQVAAPFVPGGAIVSAALAGANHAATMGMGGGSPSYVATGTGGIGGTSAGGTFGSSVSGLTSGGTSTVGSSGSYGTDGSLVVPGRRPGLGTDISQPASNFSSGTTSTGTETSDAFNQMMAATRQMSEFQASFNLQYLQLQEKIQIDTRQFNLISNIMKTKHDAAKNALNNVR